MTKLPGRIRRNCARDILTCSTRPVSARLALPAMLLGAFAIFVFGLVHLGFSPARMLAGLHQLGWITMMMFPPDPGSSLPLYLNALGETLSIALLGTTLAAVFALPVSLLAAKNIVPSNIFRFPIRRFLDSIRGVDTLIWALVWINVVGLGPFAGVLAIAVSDFGAFGKLFSEAIEAADRKQVEGIRASGGTALHEIRFGLMPQVMPVIAGQMLYFFESNTRSATIIGIVGAGGIGLQLAEQIRVLEWQQVSFLILMVLIAVAAIDWISGKLRFAIIGTTRGYMRRSAILDRNSMRSAAKRARVVSNGLPSASTSVLSTTRTGRPSAKIEPRGVGGVDNGRGDPGRSPAIIADAVMRKNLGHGAGAFVELPGLRKALCREPGGADADRRAVGQSQRFDPDQRRAGLETELPRQFACRRLFRCAD